MCDCYLKNDIKDFCTGCNACKSICPKNAISMFEDDEGFRYPYISKDKCINCGLCVKVCPILKQLPETIPHAFYYITNSDEKLFEATSGGAFGDIVEVFFNNPNSYVFGCTYDSKLNVIHCGVNNLEDANQFKKSKYVQSNMLNTFKEVKHLLNNNYNVLFSGTPCQIAGLKSFLIKDYDNLLCVDIICHGVPSQKVFDYYINCEEKKYNSKIKKVVFREKVKNSKGNYTLKNIKLVFENGFSIIKSVDKSSYFLGFQQRLFYRPSCYKCIFASKKRYSDITLCDVWGIGDSKEIESNKGMSGIIVNTTKGKKIVDKIRGKKVNMSIDYIVKINECYTKPTKLNNHRDRFFLNLNKDNFEKKAFKYSKKSLIKKICGRLKKYIILLKKI